MLILGIHKHYITRITNPNKTYVLPNVISINIMSWICLRVTTRSYLFFVMKIFTTFMCTVIEGQDPDTIETCNPVNCYSNSHMLSVC